ncbi:MAG: hypothetical protein J6M64_12930 [Oscillospiraceae bacterium]|nr:hypothetical protein [Oscillospiraceae bacterium]
MNQIIQSMLQNYNNGLITFHKISETDSFDLAVLKNSLSEKFSAVDFNAAREDVLPFVDNSRFLDAFDRDIFLSTLEYLQPSEKYTSSA